MYIITDKNGQVFGGAETKEQAKVNRRFLKTLMPNAKLKIKKE